MARAVVTVLALMLVAPPLHAAGPLPGRIGAGLDLRARLNARNKRLLDKTGHGKRSAPTARRSHRRRPPPAHIGGTRSQAAAPKSLAERDWKNGPCYRYVPEAARLHDIEPALLAALIHIESRGRPDAVSPAGAIGCGQLMPSTARLLGVDPWDPRQNVLGAAAYLRRVETYLRGTYPVDELGFEPILAGYNCGPGRVKKDGGRITIPRTRKYVDRVMETWRALRALAIWD